jgi:hypothetical protein
MMVQIKKLDKPVSTTGAEESQKSQFSGNSKSRSSKGIAESESKFESAKPGSLFQTSKYSSARSTTIADGSSNTIVVGEQQDGTSAPQGTKLQGTGGQKTSTLPSSEQQQPVGTKDGSTIGSTGEGRQPNLVVIGDGSVRTVTPEIGQQQNTTVTDGTSNTIIVGEQNASEASQGSNIEISGEGTKQPVTSKDGTKVGSDASTENGSNNQQGNTATITDGSSNTISFGEQSTEESTESSSDSTNQDTSSTTEVTDGTSNTIVVG